MKKWQCSICGYIHTGEEPPENCPVCGADKSQFVELIEKEETPARSSGTAEAAEATTPEPSETKTPNPPKAPLFSYDGVTDLLIKHHAHPISTHFPNGMIPAAVFFLFLAVMFQFAGLGKASFYNMVFVLLTLPAVLFTGYNEWQKKYKGAKTHIFMTKIAVAAVVCACALISVIWYLADPGVLQTPSTGRTLFLLLHLVLLGATGVAGHIGGKLVFKD